MRPAAAALIAIATVASSGLASAQSSYLWEELGSSDGMTVSYNPLTVRHTDGQVSFLEKVSFASPVPISNGKKMSYYTVEMTIAYTVYGGDGDVIPNVQDPTPAGMNPIPPEGAPIAFKAKFCK